MGRFPLSFMPLTCLALFPLSACAPPARNGGFDSGNPAARFYAIEEAVRTGDRSAVAHIVPALDSDDPAERLLAIEALRRLTGETLGYAYDLPRDEREAAVRRWSIRITGEDHAHE